MIYPVRVKYFNEDKKKEFEKFMGDAISKRLRDPKHTSGLNIGLEEGKIRDPKDFKEFDVSKEGSPTINKKK